MIVGTQASQQGIYRIGAFALVFLLLFQMASFAPGQAGTPRPDLSFGPLRLPLSFERNAGQTDQSVAYLTRGLGGTLFFRANEVVFSLPDERQQAATLRLQFLGANSSAQVVGLQQESGTVNYLLGSDPSAWQTDIHTFASILYQDLYPGIDLRYDGAAGQLKGTYLVAPGADPSQIEWRHKGAQSVNVDPVTGELLVAFSGRTVIEQAPIVWQDIRGRRLPVAARYQTDPGGSVRFVLGSYNRAYPLIIDPTLTYSTYLGGSSADYAYDIAVDDQGSIYVTGATASADFPLAGPLQTKRNGFGDLFVTKLNAGGASLAYSTYLGGNDSDVGFGIDVDSAGNAYVTGESWSSNFPVVNPILPNNPGIQQDVIVFKLNPAGNTLVYSTYLGGHNSQTGRDIAVDASGSAYITGHTLSSTYPVKNAFQPQIRGTRDAFVTKLNATGSELVYSSFLGSNGDLDYGYAIAIDQAGSAYVTGQTYLEGFPTVNAVQPVSGGFGEAFVTKVEASGSALAYSTYLGGGVNERGTGIAVDNQGNAYITGPTESTNFPTANAYQPVKNGYEDIFVTKINAAGSALVYSTYLGGSNPDGNYDSNIAVDEAGNAYVASNTDSADFPTVNAIQPVFGGHASDAVVVRFNAEGSALLYSTFLGGSSTNAGLGDYAYGLALDGRGNAYVTGYTFARDFPLAGGSYQANNRGNYDAFIAIINNEPSTLPSPTPSPTPTLTPTPDPQLVEFSLEVSPLSQSVKRGQTTFYSIKLTALGGFSGDIHLSVSGLPNRTNAVFTNNPVTLGPNATIRYSRLDVTTQRNAPTGTYTLTITATGGGKTYTQNVTITVSR